MRRAGSAGGDAWGCSGSVAVREAGTGPRGTLQQVPGGSGTGLRGDLEVHLSRSRMGGLLGPARCHARPPGRSRSLLQWGNEGRELEASLHALGSLSKGLNPLLEKPRASSFSGNPITLMAAGKRERRKGLIERVRGSRSMGREKEKGKEIGREGLAGPREPDCPVCCCKRHY